MTEKILSPGTRPALHGRRKKRTNWREFSHFHLDRSRAALGKPRASVEDLCKRVRHDRQFQFKLNGGVVIFCDPETYPSSKEVQHLTQAGYKIAIGLHQKYLDSNTEAAFPAFQCCLSTPEVSKELYNISSMTVRRP